MDALQLLSQDRIVPVVVIEDKSKAVGLAETLVEAGLTTIEVTLRTHDALAAIELIAAGVPDMLVGAGSVREPAHFSQIKTAGARFAVSPGATPALIDAAYDAQMPFVPGAATASEILGLQARGYQLLKFFPAELSGGTGMLKALSAPLPEVKFFPTGGISSELAPSYLALSCVHCIGGSWFVPGELLASGQLAQIGKLAKAAAELVGSS